MRELKEFKTQGEVIEFLGKDLPMKFDYLCDGVAVYTTVTPLDIKHNDEHIKSMGYGFRLEVFQPELTSILDFESVGHLTLSKKVFKFSCKIMGGNECHYEDLFISKFEDESNTPKKD